MQDTTVPTGTAIGSRYRLDARIAAGGMATVYSATDEVLGRRVAVKIMHPALASDPGFVERFRREARSAAGLGHPNIVTVHDWGRDGDTVFMVMELLGPTSLRELLHREGALEPGSVLHLVSAVAAALDHAHAKGIVHRDVKPENVLFSADGTVKVVDFGIARALADGGARLTTDTVLGTAHYIAPEQLGDAEAGPPADIYALGVMTYEMLAGKTPFAGDTAAAVAAARLSRSVPSPGISPRIDGAIARATALRPESRPATAGEFAAELGAANVPDHLRDTQPKVSTLAPMPTTVVPKPRRRRRWRWALVAAALLAAGVGAYAVLGPRYTTVPELGGRSVGDATEVLREAALLAGSRSDVFQDAPPGTIVSTKPAAGERLRRGETVALVVSKGPEMLELPVVVGRGLEEAQDLIVRSGFESGEVTEDFDSRPRGTVAQQSPAEGTARRGTAIDLVVSKGPELVAVPDAAAKTFDQAKAAIAGAGFAVARNDEFSETVAQGQVIRTAPGAGQKAAKGSTVTVVVSKGAKPFEMPNLVGMDRAAAKAKAQSLGLVVANEYAVPGSGRPKGQVLGQNPPAGTDVRKGARVEVHYAA